MSPPHRQSTPFPSQPSRFNGIDILTWLLCSWSMLYALVLPKVPTASPAFQDAFRYAPIVVMVGVGVILLAALREAHLGHQRNYRLACLALLSAQLLNIVAILNTIDPYVGGSTVGFSGGFVIFVFVYISLIFSIGCFVPFWRFPRIPVLRITLDTALMVAIADVLLRLLLPAVVPGWNWNAPLLAAAFRLESSIGLFVWYTRLFVRFGDTAVVPVWLWLLGFACLVINDTLVLWATFVAPLALGPVRAAIPFWMLNQTLWALALYRNRSVATLWRKAEPLASSIFSPPLWQQIVRLLVTLTTLAIVVAVGPSQLNVLWFFCALVSSELVTLFERRNAMITERIAREDLDGRHQELAVAHDELLRTQQELFRANAQLQQQGQYQATQLERRQITAAEIAHDMGNILQAVKVTLSLIEAQLEERQPQLIPRLGEYLYSADGALRMSENLLRTMVAAAQFDAGALRLNLQAVDSLPLLKDVVEHQLTQTRGRRVQIDLAVPPTLPLVLADKILLTRALLNIVGNAVKYTAGAHKRGSAYVVIRGEVRGSRVVFTVEDNGPGIAPETLARLGQPFVRGVEGSAAPAGFGMGLSFSRAVVEQHPGGAFAIVSQVDHGTTVMIELASATVASEEQARELGA